MPSSTAAKTGLRARQKARRREEILRAAAELFATKGFDDTHMSEIAARVEVSTPTIFNYFGTKEELLLAVVSETNEEVRTRAEEIKTAWQGDTIGGICAFLCALADLSDTSLAKQAWRHAEATLFRNPGSAFVKEYASVDDKNTHEIEQFFRANLPDDKYDKETVALLARVVYSHWLQLFFDYIRNEAQSLDTFNARIDRETRHLLTLILN